jgi:alkanesulfonate monooxygenase SsuD/methylene tetrahydromethanopterin reductase-like flavin-dependent oxidoreductase (luciferase family)
MDIGLALWTLRSTAAIPGSSAAMHAELAPAARRVESAGYHSLWVAEHHFWYDGWTPTPLVTASALLAATERLHVGTGIHLLPIGDPQAVAREVESLHRLSGGRFEYGVGLGYRAAEYDGFGLSRRMRGKRMDAALDHLLGRWGSDREDRPTIWVGGFAEAAIQRTASRGLAALLPSTLRTDQIRRAIGQFTAAAEAAGKRPGKIGVIKYTWLAESPREREQARALHASLAAEYTGSWFPLKGRPGFEAPGLVDAQIDRAIDTGLVGTVDEVLHDLTELRDAGVEMVVLHLLGDGRAPGTSDMVERLANAVIPEMSGVSA